jgi:hypothetical protein
LGTITLSPRAGSGNGGFRKDIGHYVRSHYEYIFARWLHLRGVEYSYEPAVFDILAGGVRTTYRPDFRVGGVWIEIKNPFNAKDAIFRAKFRAFIEQHGPVHAMVVIGDSRWGLARDDASISAVMESHEDLAKIVGIECRQ